MDTREGYSGPRIESPVRAIRAKCLNCSSFNEAEVRNCIINACPLFPFRMGRNPYRTRTMTDEQRIACAERLKAARNG